MRTKVHIIRHDNPKSHEYSKTASQSCERLGVEWEYFEGFTNISAWEAFNLVDLGYDTEKTFHKYYEETKQKNKFKGFSPTGCNRAAHIALWKKIADGEDSQGIIFEHDSILLHPLSIEIPNGVIACLGYKIPNPNRYDHKKAGEPKGIVPIKKHSGSHAYAITKKTAQMLIQEMVDRAAPLSNMDQSYFLRGFKGDNVSKIPLVIVNPTPAIAWVRDSTIWKSANDQNQPFIESFQKNLK